MPLVRVRLFNGTRLLGAPVRPMPRAATLQTVLAKVLEGYPGAAVQLLEAFPGADEKPTDRSEFQPNDFGEITVGELADQSLGLFWVARVLYAAEFQSPPPRSGASSSSSLQSSLPNPLEELMRREQTVRVTWPPNASSFTFEGRIFNALIADLKAQCMGFHYADAGPQASGTSLLKALAKALQYALPFDLKGALARRAMYIPDCFKADALKVHAVRIAPCLSTCTHHLLTC